jgi:hypothetical protein
MTNNVYNKMNQKNQDTEVKKPKSNVVNVSSTSDSGWMYDKENGALHHPDHGAIKMKMEPHGSYSVEHNNAGKRFFESKNDMTNHLKGYMKDLHSNSFKKSETYNETLMKALNFRIEELSKSNYGPKGAGLYNQTDNLNRKKTRTGEEVEGAGKNKAVRQYTSATMGTGKAQADRVTAEQKKKNKKQPVKVGNKEEIERMNRERGLLKVNQNGQWEIEKSEWKPKKEHKSDKGGLTQKGRDSYNKKTGGNLKAPVTSDNPSEGEKKRRKSFCARMGNMKGPLKDEKGRPTRKKKALDRWKC